MQSRKRPIWKYGEVEFEITPEMRTFLKREIVFDSFSLRQHWKRQAADYRQQIADLQAKLAEAEAEIKQLEAIGSVDES